MQTQQTQFTGYGQPQVVNGQVIYQPTGTYLPPAYTQAGGYTYNQQPVYNTHTSYSTQQPGYTTGQYETPEQRTAREHQTVVAKGHQVVDKVNQIRSGEANAHMPSNQDISYKLGAAEHAITGLQNSSRGSQVGGPGQQVANDVKTLIGDQNLLLQKNQGDLLQNTIRHAIALGRQLQGESSIGSMFENWGGILTSVAGSGESKDIFHTGSELFRSMKDTESFLDLLSELIELMKIFVLKFQTAATEGLDQAKDAHNEHMQEEKEKIFEQIRNTLSILTTNDLWQHMLHQSRTLASQAKEGVVQGGQQTKGGLYTFMDTEAAQVLTNDFKTILQRLVGNQMDVTPLFDYTKAGLQDIAHDKPLHDLAAETEEVLNEISNHPEIANQPEVKQHLMDLTKRAEVALANLRKNPNLHRAREESHRIKEIIRNDPDNHQLVEDAKQLWRDIRSDDSGHLIDPALLQSVKQMIIPLFLEHLQNVPLPPQHDVVNKFGRTEYKVENIHISVPALIPEHIHIRFEYDMDAAPMTLGATNQRAFAFVEAKNVQVQLHNVAWAYNRLTAPHRQDSGHVDFATTGAGITIRMAIELSSNLSNSHVLDIRDVTVLSDKFVIKVTDSKHNKLYQTVTHMFAGKIRKSVQSGLRQKLIEMGPKMNEKAVMLMMEAKTKSHSLYSLAQKQKQTRMEQMRDRRESREGAPGMKEKAAGILHAGRESEMLQQQKNNVVNMGVGKVLERLDETQKQIDDKRDAMHAAANAPPAGTLPPSGSHNPSSHATFDGVGYSHPLGPPAIPATLQPSEVPLFQKETSELTLDEQELAKLRLAV